MEQDRFEGDGWDCDALYVTGLMDTLNKIERLKYALEHNNRASCNFGDTWEDLEDYVKELAQELQDAVEE
jgi:hypothetical protein